MADPVAVGVASPTTLRYWRKCLFVGGLGFLHIGLVFLLATVFCLFIDWATAWLLTFLIVTGGFLVASLVCAAWVCMLDVLIR